MKFILDANVLIEAHRRYYAFDLAGTFWDALVTWGGQKILGVPQAVYEEIANEKDELASWLRKHRAVLIIRPDHSVFSSAKEIAQFIQSRYEPSISQLFLDSADLWVVAHAKALSATVVTLEAPRQEIPTRKTGRIGGRKISLANVCRHFHINHINTFDMLRQLQFRF